MKLITYATHDSGYFRALELSSQKNGFQLIVLGFNKKWEGFTQKIIDIIEYLKEFENKDEIICFVDGFDCIVLGTADEMLIKYKNTNSDKILFAADTDSPFTYLIFGKVNDRDAGTTYNRLNSGCYIGKVKEILNLLTNLCNLFECKVESNDQTLITLYYDKCVDCLNIDFNRNLFYNLQNLDTLNWQYLTITNTYNSVKAPLSNKYYKLENDRIILDNGNKPIILHGNGNTNMDLIVEKLGYPIGKKDNKNYHDYSVKSIINIVKTVNPFITDLLYYIVAIFHICFILYTSLFVFFTNDVFLLSILILVIYIMTLQWFINGKCILTDIENILSNSQNLNSDGKSSILFNNIGQYLSDDLIYYATIFGPLTVFIIALTKINNAVYYS